MLHGADEGVELEAVGAGLLVLIFQAGGPDVGGVAGCGAALLLEALLRDKVELVSLLVRRRG